MSGSGSFDYRLEYHPPGAEEVHALPSPSSGDRQKIREWFDRLTTRLVQGEDLRGDPAGWLVECMHSEELACRVIDDPELALYSRGGWSLGKYAVRFSPSAAEQLIDNIKDFGWPQEVPGQLWPLLEAAVRHWDAAKKVLDRPQLAEWCGPPPQGDNLATQIVHHHQDLGRRILLDERLRDLESVDGMTLAGFVVGVLGSPRSLSKVLSVGPALKASCRAVHQDGEAVREMTIFEALHTYHAHTKPSGTKGLEGRSLRAFQQTLLRLDPQNFQVAYSELARLDPPAATSMLEDLGPAQWAELKPQDLTPLLTQSDPDLRQQALQALSKRPGDLPSRPDSVGTRDAR